MPYNDGVVPPAQITRTFSSELHSAVMAMGQDSLNNYSPIWLKNPSIAPNWNGIDILQLEEDDLSDQFSSLVAKSFQFDPPSLSLLDISPSNGFHQYEEEDSSDSDDDGETYYDVDDSELDEDDDLRETPNSSVIWGTMINDAEDEGIGATFRREGSLGDPDQIPIFYGARTNGATATPDYYHPSEISPIVPHPRWGRAEGFVDDSRLPSTFLDEWVDRTAHPDPDPLPPIEEQMWEESSAWDDEPVNYPPPTYEQATASGITWRLGDAFNIPQPSPSAATIYDRGSTARTARTRRFNERSSRALSRTTQPSSTAITRRRDRATKRSSPDSYHIEPNGDVLLGYHTTSSNRSSNRRHSHRWQFPVSTHHRKRSLLYSKFRGLATRIKSCFESDSSFESHKIMASSGAWGFETRTNPRSISDGWTEVYREPAYRKSEGPRIVYRSDSVLRLAREGNNARGWV